MADEGIPIMDDVDEEGGFSPLRIAIFILIIIVLASLIWWFVRSRKPAAPGKVSQEVSSIVSAIRNPSTPPTPTVVDVEPPLRNDMPVPVYNDPIAAPPVAVVPTVPTPSRPAPSAPSVAGRGMSRPIAVARPVGTPPRSTNTGPGDQEVGTSVPLPL